jgi:hypothetical protein
MKGQREERYENDAAAEAGEGAEETGGKRAGEDQRGEEQQGHRLR